MVWYIIRANILLIVNVILTDGIRMFLNTLVKKIEDNCKITIVFLYWNNKPLIQWFSIKYEPTLCSLLVFVLAPAGLGKIQRNSQTIRTYYMLNQRIRCMYKQLLKRRHHGRGGGEEGGWYNPIARLTWLYTSKGVRLNIIVIHSNIFPILTG